MVGKSTLLLEVIDVVEADPPSNVTVFVALAPGISLNSILSL